MLPLIKVFSLIIRVFSKPVISYTKKYHTSNEVSSKRLKAYFIWLGNYYHRLQTKINKKFLKIHTQTAFKPLNDNLAVQKGVQFFYQIIFYCIVIGFPIVQMYIAAQQSKTKSNETNSRLSRIQEKTKEINSKLSEIAKQKQQQNRIMQQLKQKIPNYQNKISLKTLCYERPLIVKESPYKETQIKLCFL